MAELDSYTITAADGDTIEDGYLNGVAGMITRVKKSDATARSTTSATFVDSGTSFSTSIPTNSLILSISLRMEISNSASQGFVCLKLDGSFEIDGSTESTAYLIYRSFTSLAANNDTLFPKYSTVEDDLFHFSGTSYAEFCCDISTPIKILSGSQTWKPRIRNSSGSDTTYIKNVFLDIVYVTGFTDA